MSGECSTHGRDEKSLKILVGKPEGKRPLGRLGVGGKIILELILGNRVERCGLDASASG
jgi:hypothetical protein